MREKLINNIKELTDRRELGEIILESVNELKINRKSAWQYIISAAFGFGLGIFVGFSKDTVKITIDVSKLFFSTSISIIGIIIGAYAVFQALLQKELILLLIKSENNLLKESNKTFLNIIVLYTINVIISLSIMIVLSAFPFNVLLFQNLMFNNIIASALVSLYFIFNLLLLLEIINFTVNLYRMFCVHNTVKAIEILESEDEEEE